MNSSFKKLVISFALVLAFLVVVPISNAQVTTVTYTHDLNLGDTGIEVTSLQSMLYSSGYITVPPTGYFDSLTQKALVAWQSAMNITAESGYVGPATRAYLTNTTIPGCPIGAVYSQITSQPCATGSTAPTAVPGCFVGASFSSVTGQSCKTQTTTSSASQSQPYTQTCTDLSVNLSLGIRDVSANNQVTTLQKFLVIQNYLDANVASAGYGYFGANTQKAVKLFQKANGIDSTGFVGALTRAKIKKISCPAASISVPVFNMFANPLSNNGRNIKTSQTAITSNIPLGIFSIVSQKDLTIKSISFRLNLNSSNPSVKPQFNSFRLISGNVDLGSGSITQNMVGSTLVVTFSNLNIQLTQNQWKDLSIYSDIAPISGSFTLTTSINSTDIFSIDSSFNPVTINETAAAQSDSITFSN